MVSVVNGLADVMVSAVFGGSSSRWVRREKRDKAELVLPFDRPSWSDAMMWK